MIRILTAWAFAVLAQRLLRMASFPVTTAALPSPTDDERSAVRLNFVPLVDGSGCVRVEARCGDVLAYRLAVTPERAREHAVEMAHQLAPFMLQ